MIIASSLLSLLLLFFLLFPRYLCSNLFASLCGCLHTVSNNLPLPLLVLPSGTYWSCLLLLFVFFDCCHGLCCSLFFYYEGSVVLGLKGFERARGFVIVPVLSSGAAFAWAKP